MPRSKYNHALRNERQRTCWIRFSLPPDEDWPTWPTSYDDRYLGPLAGAAGCQDAIVGRQVDNPREAVFVIFWESAEALRTFQETPASRELLQGLGCGNESIVRLRYMTGGTMQSLLPGRVTLNIFTIPYTGTPNYDEWCDTILSPFCGFMPKGGGAPGRPQIFRFPTCAWEEDDQQVQPTTEGIEQKQATFYLFYCWQGSDTSMKEEISANDPESKNLWAERVARASPPVESWVQERWHIRYQPCEIDPEEKDNEDLADFVSTRYLQPRGK
ncbi:hypothetical protein NPX13_g7849 [Xylaria arbuscula]|uniref:ABM domain-containing protein n=1 Tax=Xylaria arbuscula TaxID=114810 RepID=A0A9W8TIW2_9PEZI|nr:hypothetical protein NPX13_g7849 [Xylaria arbuscula]